MSDETKKEPSLKGATNVMVNVSLNIDKELDSQVMVEVLRDATVLRNIGEQLAKSVLEVLPK